MPKSSAKGATVCKFHAGQAKPRENYGEQAAHLTEDAPTVELDALPADELRRRVEQAVTGLIDPERWQRQVAVQQVELNCIIEFAERIKNLPQVQP